MHIFRFFKAVIESILVFLIFTIAILNIFSGPSKNGVLGFRGYTVISASMEPALKVGDYIIVKHQPFSSIEKKDIISYRESDMVITHRVAEKQKNFLRTRGDNNAISDFSEVTPETYLGTYVLHIHYLGQVLIWLQNPLTFALVLGLIALRLAILIFFKR